MPFAPTSDIVTTGWTPSTGVEAFAVLDDVVADDGDYVQSPSLSASPGPLVMGVASSAAGTYVVNLRARYLGTNGQVRVSLLDGANVLQGTSDWVSVTAAFATYSISVTTTGPATRLRVEVQSDLPPGYLGLDGGALSLDGGVLGLN